MQIIIINKLRHFEQCYDLLKNETFCRGSVSLTQSQYISVIYISLEILENLTDEKDFFQISLNLEKQMLPSILSLSLASNYVGLMNLRIN